MVCITLTRALQVYNQPFCCFASYEIGHRLFYLLGWYVNHGSSEIDFGVFLNAWQNKEYACKVVLMIFHSKNKVVTENLNFKWQKQHTLLKTFFGLKEDFLNPFMKTFCKTCDPATLKVCNRWKYQVQYFLSFCIFRVSNLECCRVKRKWM